MPQKPTKLHHTVSRTSAEKKLIEAANVYAKALAKMIEMPTPENSQTVIEKSRDVMKRAAEMLPQETLMRLAKVQAENRFKDG